MSLSSTSLTTIEIDCFFENIDFSSTITRARFEKLNMDLFEECIVTVDICLKDAKMEKSEVHDIVLVGGSSQIPKVQQLLVDFFGGNQLCKNINPNEAVAIGASAHAAILSGINNKDFPLVDVAPLSLGVETFDGSMAVLIPRNTPIPTRQERLFTTAIDNQTTVSVPVFEGERHIARDNNLLSTFLLEWRPILRRGAPRINICFEIDVDGILRCFARELNTGIMHGITITDHRGRLFKKEIERMMREAEKFNAADEHYRQKVKATNALENYVDDMKRLLRYNGDKIGIKDMRKMVDAVDQAIQWVDWNFLAEACKFEDKMKELQSICEPFVKRMHQQPGAAVEANDQG